MSALESPRGARPAPARRAGGASPLHPVPAARPRLARMPFVGVLIAVFGLGMAGLLLLNTSLQSQAFEARRLDRQAAELAYAQADLQSQIDQLAAPQELARRASALKLRPNPRPAFLVLPEGRVIGKAGPVTGAEVPSLVIKTPAELAAERAAAAAKKRAAEARAAAAAAEKAAASRARELAAQRPAASAAPRRAATPAPADPEGDR